MDADVEDAIKWVARGAGVMIIGTFASKAIMYFYRILVARYLGAADYGTLSLALAVFWVFMAFGNLNIQAGVERFVSKYVGSGEDDSKIKGVIVSGFSVTVPTTLLAAVILFFMAPLIASHFFDSPDAVLYLRVFAVAMPFQLIYQMFSNVSSAHKQLGYVALVDKIYRSLATLTVTAALIFAGYGLMGAVIAQLVAILTASLLMLYLVETRVFSFLRTPSKEFRNYHELFHYSYPLLFTSIIGLVTGWTDTLMLGWFDTTSNVGIYNAALPTAQVLGVFGTGFSSILFPVVSSLYGEGKKEKSVDVAATGVKWLLAMSFPLLLVTMVFASPIMRLLFGEVYTAGATALLVLGVAYFTHAIASYAGAYIKSEDRTKLSLLNSGVAAVLNFGLNLYLVPKYSTTGAGIATAISLAAGATLAMAEVYLLFGVNPLRIRKLLPSFLATTGAAVTTYGLVKLLYDPTPPWVLIPAFLLFGALYAVLFLLLGGLQEDDVAVLNAVDDRIDADLTPIRRIVRKIAW